jgi:hypothetical protein
MKEVSVKVIGQDGTGPTGMLLKSFVKSEFFFLPPNSS